MTTSNISDTYRCPACGQTVWYATGHICPAINNQVPIYWQGVGTYQTITPQGWECPKCHCVYAPSVMMCFNCGDKVTQTSAGATIGELLEKKAWQQVCTCGVIIEGATEELVRSSAARHIVEFPSHYLPKDPIYTTAKVPTFR